MPPMDTTAFRARAVLAALALALPPVAAALPASAAPERVVYDALGDSYAAGYGAGPVTGLCAQSPLAHPEVLDGRMRIRLDDLAACSGATAAATQANNLAPQLAYLDADTDLVTLSIGGNDIGWGTVVGACLYGTDQQCAAALAGATAAVTHLLPGILDAAYTSVAAAAPDAHVVVTGYPRLFSPEYGDYLGASVAEQQAMNDAADLLNAVIAQAAAEHGFQFVDVTSRFEGHGVNSPEPWISPANFHPTAKGQKAYATALTAAINPRDLR